MSWEALWEGTSRKNARGLFCWVVAWIVFTLSHYLGMERLNHWNIFFGYLFHSWSCSWTKQSDSLRAAWLYCSFRIDEWGVIKGSLLSLGSLSLVETISQQLFLTKKQQKMQILPYLFRATTWLADVLRLLAHIAHFHTQWYLGPVHIRAVTQAVNFSHHYALEFFIIAVFSSFCVFSL